MPQMRTALSCGPRLIWESESGLKVFDFHLQRRGFSGILHLDGNDDLAVRKAVVAGVRTQFHQVKHRRLRMNPPDRRRVQVPNVAKDFDEFYVHNFGKRCCSSCARKTDWLICLLSKSACSSSFSSPSSKERRRNEDDGEHDYDSPKIPLGRKKPFCLAWHR